MQKAFKVAPVYGTLQEKKDTEIPKFLGGRPPRF